MNIEDRIATRDENLLNFYYRQAPSYEDFGAAANFWGVEQKEMRGQVSKCARERLYKATNELPLNGRSNVIEDVLTIYNWSEEDIRMAEYESIYFCAYSYIATDLLIRSLIEPNGKKTRLAVEAKCFFDPTRYYVATKPWDNVVDWMSMQLFLAWGVDPDAVLKEQRSDGFEHDRLSHDYWILKKYEYQFGSNAVILLPKKIMITDKKVEIPPGTVVPRSENASDRDPFGLVFFPDEIVEQNSELL